MKLLITDSNAEVISALRLVLEQRHNLEVIQEANDIVALFSNIVQLCPDVLILDVDLLGVTPSKQDSISSLTMLMTTVQNLCNNIYVIALSKLPNLERICLQSGVNVFACKSDPPDRLLKILDNYFVLSNSQKKQFL